MGDDLTHYDVDVAGAELIKRETVTLPAAVQYAWPHAIGIRIFLRDNASTDPADPAINRVLTTAAQHSLPVTQALWQRAIKPTNICPQQMLFLAPLL